MVWLLIYYTCGNGMNQVLKVKAEVQGIRVITRDRIKGVKVMRRGRGRWGWGWEHCRYCCRMWTGVHKNVCSGRI